ncbi:myosin light chain alkali [Brevipalpus obovatus]|uniref:myosin light chain alkali n=1 Tax=Brevipalpus obovatus TaxID=246614 RepID=UPI003D9E5BA8
MADLAGKDVEKVKLHFDIYDFEGQGRIDAYKLGDIIRSLDLRPTNAAIEKAGGTKRRGEKWITLEEFLPIYSELKKNKDVGAYEDMVEGLKMYDKHENGLMMSAEMAHTLVALGERLESREVEDIMKACAGPSDIDGMIKYDLFVKALMAGPYPEE